MVLRISIMYLSLAVGPKTGYGIWVYIIISSMLLAGGSREG